MGTMIVSSLGKAYKKYNSRWARLAEWIFPFLGERHQLKWVLKDISFSVYPGEALGIIGINGAGKSTLLKMIAGTVQPTTGEVAISGKVAALLELGMGFHPDFTGRQNVYMAGQLLGYSSGEITSLMPEIEAFAEIGDYIDQPARVYSSGMQMRLAFSIATVRRPDVLIVDEALSVGDAYFQHKSFDRIREFRKSGTTLLIVSHDKAAIQSICDRAILLNQGEIETEGLPEVVMDFYNAMLGNKDPGSVNQKLISGVGVSTKSGSQKAIIESVGLFDKDNNNINLLNVGQKIKLVISVLAIENLPKLVVGYLIKDRLGQPIFGTNTHHLDRNIIDINADDRYEFKFIFDINLGEGSYSIAVALHPNQDHIDETYEWRDLAVVFEVRNLHYQKFVGVAWLPPILEIK